MRDRQFMGSWSGMVHAKPRVLFLATVVVLSEIDTVMEPPQLTVLADRRW